MPPAGRLWVLAEREEIGGGEHFDVLPVAITVVRNLVEEWGAGRFTGGSSRPPRGKGDGEGEKESAAGEGDGHPVGPPDTLLLLRPPTPDEKRLIRSAAIRSHRLYCSVSTGGLPLTIPPAALLPLTPLEAVVQYLHREGKEYSLDQETLQRCIARRDGWAGLHRLGLSWNDAEKVLAEIGALSLANDLQDEGNRLRLAELDLELRFGEPPSILLFPAPGEPAAERKSEKPFPCEEPRPLLVFHGKRNLDEAGTGGGFSTDDITAIEFVGPVRWKRWCLRLMADERYAYWHRMRLEHGEELLRFRVTPLEYPCNRQATEALIGGMLEVLLGAGRPLRDWGLTLFLPLPPPSDAGESPGGCTGKPATQNGIQEVSLNTDLLEAAQKLSGIKAVRRVREGELYAIDREEAEYQAMLYFSPAVRKQVFEEVGHWRLENPERFRIRVDLTESHLNHHPGDIEVPVSDVSLYRHPTGQMLLAVRFQWRHEGSEPSWRREDEAGVPWWADLLVPAWWPAARRDQMAVWLLAARSLRWLYRSFREEERERSEGGRKFLRLDLLDPESRIASGFTAAIHYHRPLFRLLAGFFPKYAEKGGEKMLWNCFSGEQESDRLYISTAFALAGPPPGSPDAEQGVRRLFSLALYVDTEADGFAGQDGFAYDRRFVEQRLSEHGYHRWEGVGTFIGHTDNATACLGFGDYFVRPVARLHLPYIYNRFIILALLQHHALRHLQRRAQRLPVAMGKDQEWEQLQLLKKKLRKLRGEFINFTNRYWVHHPTEQIQGKEMYHILARTFSLEETHALAREKLEQAGSFASTRVQEMYARIGRAAGHIALFLTFAGLLFSDAAEAIFGPALCFLYRTIGFEPLPAGADAMLGVVTRLFGASLLGFMALPAVGRLVGVKRDAVPPLGIGVAIGLLLVLLPLFPILSKWVPVLVLGPAYAFVSIGLLIWVAGRLWKNG